MITPLLYIHMINLRSLEGKTFFAGIIGFTLPYWLLLGYDLYTDQAEEFYNAISHILQFDQIIMHPYISAIILYGELSQYYGLH